MTTLGINSYKQLCSENLWINWLNSSIYINVNDRIEESISICKYLETVFINLLDKFRKKGINFTCNDKIILNNVMNNYFNLWRLNKKSPVSKYENSLTVYGKTQKKKGLLPTAEMIECLDRKFTDSFWLQFQNEFGIGYGIFDPELSEFGRIFWNNIQYFLYQFINTEYLESEIIEIERVYNRVADSNITMSAPMTHLQENNNSSDDPYLVDQHVAKELGINW
jgi:hypothetical protein